MSQYIGERAATDPITIFVYGGNNGKFTLYEDDGVSFAYEGGQFAEIPLKWDERAHTLTIGPRQGSFAGMLKERTFRVALVSSQQPIGYSQLENRPTLSFNGGVVSVQVR